MFLNKNRGKSAESDKITKDFTLRAPFALHRAFDYKDYEPFAEINFQPILDKHLERLCAGEIDEGNKGALDPIVSNMAAQAEQDLDRQRADRIDLIHSTRARRAGDKPAFERQLEKLQTMLAQNEKELAEMERRHKVNSF